MLKKLDIINEWPLRLCDDYLCPRGRGHNWPHSAAARLWRSTDFASS